MQTEIFFATLFVQRFGDSYTGSSVKKAYDEFNNAQLQGQWAYVHKLNR
jgi:hypothetical protein